MSAGGWQAAAQPVGYDVNDLFVACTLQSRHLGSRQPGITTGSRRDLGEVITEVQPTRSAQIGVRTLGALPE